MLLDYDDLDHSVPWTIQYSAIRDRNGFQPFRALSAIASGTSSVEAHLQWVDVFTGECDDALDYIYDAAEKWIDEHGLKADHPKGTCLRCGGDNGDIFDVQRGYVICAHCMNEPSTPSAPPDLSVFDF